MAGLDETLEKDVVRREAAKVTDEGYFEAMSEEELELAKEPLVIVAESGELSKWSKDLSLRAKRRFLVDFWKRRDPTPDTPVNEARQVFYDGGGLRRQELRREGPRLGAGLEDRPGPHLRQVRGAGGAAGPGAGRPRGALPGLALSAGAATATTCLPTAPTGSVSISWCIRTT